MMLASNEMNAFNSELIVAAAQAEIDYIRRLGSKNDLMMAASNLGAYEALLIVLCSGADGVPVHHAVGQVQSRFSTQSCIIKRIGMMRQQGLILEKSGAKKSQVCLIPSEQLLQDLAPLLTSKHGAAVT